MVQKGRNPKRGLANSGEVRCEFAAERAVLELPDEIRQSWELGAQRCLKRNLPILQSSLGIRDKAFAQQINSSSMPIRATII